MWPISIEKQFDYLFRGRLKIITILGARPQFIKASTVSSLFQTQDSIDEVIIHTGQHFDKNMSAIFFNQMDLPVPHYNLGINKLSHGLMIAKMIENIEPILLKEKPVGVLVYGDTNSTLAGGLAAAKLGIPVFHVEAGLRSYNRTMPEEINRILTDHLSTLLFCPTENAFNLLKREGLQNGVIKSGDVMFDAYIKFSRLYKSKEIEFDLQIPDVPYLLATIHRPENTDDQSNLASIFACLDEINKELKVILPLHPRTKKQMEHYKIHSEINLVSPQGYLAVLNLLNGAELVITDSGGLQKEAFFTEKKCITVRKETEWTELTDAGVNFLTKPENLFNTFNQIQNTVCDFSARPYGNGYAAEIIIQDIVKYFA